MEEVVNKCNNRENARKWAIMERPKKSASTTLRTKRDHQGTEGVEALNIFFFFGGGPLHYGPYFQGTKTYGNKVFMKIKNP